MAGKSFDYSSLIGPIGLGVNLISGLLRTHSQRAMLDKQYRARMKALQPLEALLVQGKFGMSQSLGTLEQGAARRAQAVTAGRGLSDSSFGGPAVAAAVAPYEAQYQNQQNALLTQLSAAKEAIASQSALPGYGAAFADTLGVGGQYLAAIAGRHDAQKQLQFESDLRKKEFADMLRQMGTGNQQMQGDTYGQDRNAIPDYLKELRYR